MKTMQSLLAGALALAGVFAGSVQADFVEANRNGFNALSELGGPAIQADTTGCANTGFCTLTELLDGGSISAGGLTFGGFSLDFLDGYSDFDTDNVVVQVFDFGGALLLDYDFAPFGFGGPLPTFLEGGGLGAALDLSYNVTGNGTVDVVGAGVFDIGGAGFSTSDYLLDVAMEIEADGSTLAALFGYLDIVDNFVIDGSFESIGLGPLDAFTVYNYLSHIAWEDPSLLYYVDQVFFTQVREVPEPVSLGLLALGLLAVGYQRKRHS